MNTKINVEGVIPSRREVAEKEIGEYLGLFQRSFAAEAIDIGGITIAADFEKMITRLLPGLAGDGFSYKAKHRSGKAIGKTLRILDDNGISFNIVLDGAYLGKWEDDAKPTRIEVIFHELFHARLENKRFISLGKAGFRNDYRTIEGVCFSLALTRDEYIVDCYVDELCKRLLMDDNNQPVSLRQLNAARGINYRDVYLKLLEDMPGFIDNNIAGFKAGRQNTAALWNSISGYVEELLTTFAHLAGSQEREEDWADVQKTMSETPAHQKYLAGRLRVIYTEWLNYFTDDYDEAGSLQTIGEEIRGILENCGLRFKNVPEGINIRIGETG